MKNKTLAQVRQWLDEGHIIDLSGSGFEYIVFMDESFDYIITTEAKYDLVRGSKFLEVDKYVAVIENETEELHTQLEYMKPLPRKPKLLEVGDKVKILKITAVVKKTIEKYETKIFDIGSLGTVTSVSDDDLGISYLVDLDEGYDHVFPHWAVAKIIQEEE